MSESGKNRVPTGSCVPPANGHRWRKLSRLPSRIMNSSPIRTLAAAILLAAAAESASAAEIFHAQGEMAGEPSADSVLLQSRLTAIDGLSAQDDVPGAAGVARFVVSATPDFSHPRLTPWLHAQP